MKFTQAGFQNLHQEKETLLTERVRVIEDVKKSREMGDLSENGYYKASKSRLRFIDSQLHKIESILKQATLIEKPLGESIGLGSQVTLQNGDTTQNYLLVDVLEANPKEGKISRKSPLGASLLGKKKGDRVQVMTPKGTSEWVVERVQ